LYLNSNQMCIVCFKEPEDNLNLIKHHVTYYPETIAFVHFACHNKIHDPDNPIDIWIQYEPNDSKKFYREKKENGV
jgi:hypothetical protein